MVEEANRALADLIDTQVDAKKKGFAHFPELSHANL
jgi:hypothetical protein